MSHFLQDLRFGARMLARNPGFAAVAVITLALGIGANTAIYSILHAVLVRPVAVSAPERLAAITNDVISYPAYVDFRDQNGVFEDFAVFGRRQMSFSADGRAALGSLELVSGNYFSVLGVHPASGRVITPGDDTAGAQPVAVLSHAFWKRQLGGDPAIVGKTVTINAQPFTVAGVGQAGFRGTTVFHAPDAWIALSSWPMFATGSLARLSLTQRGWGWLHPFGRLKPGVTLAQAEAAMNVLARRQEQDSPRGTPRDFSVTLHPLAAAATGIGGRGDLVRFLALLAAVVAIALLIACANVANLLLARASIRAREIGTRLALGAGRARLVRQLLTEGLLLAVIGGVIGLLAAHWTIEGIGQFSLPGGIPLTVLEAGLSKPVLGFTVLLLLAVLLLFALAPAIHSSRPNLIDCAKGQAQIPAGTSYLRTAFLVAQVCLCLTLLVGAGLFVRSLRNALATDTGFRTGNVALASVNLGLRRYDEVRAAEFYRQVDERVTRLAGVQAMSWARTVPVTADIDYYSARIQGYQPQPGERVRVNTNFVGAGYFHTMGIPIVAGRAFDASDNAEGPRVLIINEALARRYFPGRNPIGSRIAVEGEAAVIGVAKDSRYESLRGQPAPLIYAPLGQSLGFAGLSQISMLVRTSSDPASIFPALRREVAALDAEVPLFHVETLDDHIGDLLVAQRLGTGVLSFFSAMALVLAVVGTYGVIAVYAGQRTREIGVRMALGARPLDILWLVLRQCFLPLTLGGALGAAGALLLTQTLSRFLYGVSAADPVTFGVATLLLAVTALSAAAVPAFRATKNDPMAALRHE